MRPFGSKTELVKLVSMILTVPVKSGWMLRSVPFAPARGEDIHEICNHFEIRRGPLTSDGTPPIAVPCSEIFPSFALLRQHHDESV